VPAHLVEAAMVAVIDPLANILESEEVVDDFGERRSTRGGLDQFVVVRERGRNATELGRRRGRGGLELRLSAFMSGVVCCRSCALSRAFANLSVRPAPMEPPSFATFVTNS
jgi:hypothetical protein